VNINEVGSLRVRAASTVGGSLPPRMLLLNGSFAGACVRLDRGPVTIGTGEECTIRLLNNQHPGARARIEPAAGGGFRLRNDGGSNIELLINDVPLFDFDLPANVPYGVGVVTARVARDAGRMPKGVRPFRTLYLPSGFTLARARPWFLSGGLEVYVRVDRGQ
jgi:hypothetical protein